MKRRRVNRRNIIETLEVWRNDLAEATTGEGTENGIYCTFIFMAERERKNKKMDDVFIYDLSGAEKETGWDNSDTWTAHRMKQNRKE